MDKATGHLLEMAIPHEATQANRIKGTFRGVNHERDAKPSQRAPLSFDQAVTIFYYVKRFYYVRLFRLVWYRCCVARCVAVHSLHHVQCGPAHTCLGIYLRA